MAKSDVTIKEVSSAYCEITGKARKNYCVCVANIV